MEYREFIRPTIIRKSKLTLWVPDLILGSDALTPNDKLILAFTYTLSKKQGHNSYSMKYMSEMLNIHHNTVSSSLKSLVSHQYLVNSQGSYTIPNKLLTEYNLDNRKVVIPYEVYSLEINAGAKLLWSEYNSFSRGRSYTASREYTARKMACSVNSISKWTRVLLEHQLLNGYSIQKKKGKKQKFVHTKDFGDDG